MTDSLSLEQRQEAMQEIAAEVAACKLCGLHTGRKKSVPGAGPINAEIMFIGEGPGYNEDQQGLPFVGASGKLLEEFLKLIGLTRDDVFIGNVVKCRPPENRDPQPEEIDACTKAYLFKQIELVNPRVIATLGRYSMGLFFPKAKISAIHGQAKKENGRAYLPLFHPAAILRNMDMKPQAEADFKKILVLLAEMKKAAEPAKPEKPSDKDEPPPPMKQLSLF